MTERVRALCREVYGANDGDRCYDSLAMLMSLYAPHTAARPSEPAGFPLSAEDVVLITYGDQFRGEGPALRYLDTFLGTDLNREIRGVHILPFNPSSSDEGFSVIDYLKVAPALGSWRDIRRISGSSLFMADLVANHCSVGSAWFERFLKGDTPYNEYFIQVDPASDLSAVFRPRTSPLLTPFEGAGGTQHLWSTFSADQIDLNYQSPQLLREIVNVLLYYVAQGARIIRLDAVAYIWKEIGSACIHHPHTHHLVRLLRAVCDAVAPQVLLLTETNVPHADNISYFGNGSNEAQMVYNFSLPPLTLDALMRGDASHLTEWATSLSAPPQCAFFNFLASHDGIGMLPAADYLSAEEQAGLVATVRERGGMVSYKETPRGNVPYELNVNYLSALSDPKHPPSTQRAAFLCAQAIMLALAGVPAPYVHSVIGSRNWRDWQRGESGKRSINRERCVYDEIHAVLQREDTEQHAIFESYRALIRARTGQKAFDPHSPQRVLRLGRKLMALYRGGGSSRGGGGGAVDGGILCLHNVSDRSAEVAFPTREVGEWQRATDIISGRLFTGDQLRSVRLRPYEVVWLSAPESG